MVACRHLRCGGRQVVGVAEAEAEALRRELADACGSLSVERTASAAKDATIATLAAHVSECEASIATAQAKAHAEAERLERCGRARACQQTSMRRAHARTGTRTPGLLRPCARTHTHAHFSRIHTHAHTNVYVRARPPSARAGPHAARRSHACRCVRDLTAERDGLVRAADQVELRLVGMRLRGNAPQVGMHPKWECTLSGNAP
jgi:hypothetical protein